jgi:hypothetical protein
MVIGVDCHPSFQQIAILAVSVVGVGSAVFGDVE